MQLLYEHLMVLIIMMYDQFSPTCIKILLSPAGKEAPHNLGVSSLSCHEQGGDHIFVIFDISCRLVGIGALAKEQECCFRVSNITSKEQWRGLRGGGGAADSPL